MTNRMSRKSWAAVLTGVFGTFFLWLVGWMIIDFLLNQSSHGFPRLLGWIWLIGAATPCAFLIIKISAPGRRIFMNGMALGIWATLAVILQAEGCILGLFGSPSEKTLEEMAAKYNPNWAGGPWEYVESGHRNSAYEKAVARWDFYRDLLVFKWEKQYWARLQREADIKAKSMSDTAGSREAK